MAILNPAIRTKIPSMSNLVDIDISVDAKYTSSAICISKNSSSPTYGCIRLMLNKEQMDLSTGITLVNCIAQLPNGMIVYLDSDIDYDSKIIVNLSDERITNQLGEVLCEIFVKGKNADGAFRFTSLIFRLDIRA